MNILKYTPNIPLFNNKINICDSIQKRLVSNQKEKLN